MTRARLAALVAATLMTAPYAASAQPTRAGAASEDDASYKPHMTNGVKLFQDKNYEAAIAEFEAAYRIRPKASPLVNIALCEKALFRYPKAIARLEKALSEHGDTLTTADKKAAEDAVRELRALLAYVTVRLEPKTATLIVDGEEQPRGAADAPVPVGPGTHRIGARAEGYASHEESVAVASGDKDKVVVVALIPDKGWVSVRAVDRATQIDIDGRPVSPGAWAGFLPPGPHAVRIHRAGEGGLAWNVVVTAGKVVEIDERQGGSPMGVPTGLPPGGDRRPEKQKPPAPPREGFYGLATGAVFALYDGDLTTDPGWSVGLRGGFRPTSIFGLEALADFRRIDGRGTFSFASNATGTFGDTKLTIQSVRLGGATRFMSRGRVVSFVQELGGGVAFNSVDLGCAGCADASGADFFLLSESGIELDFAGIFFGAVVEQGASSFLGSSNADGQTPIDGVAASIGLGLRVGYGTW